MRKRTKRKHLLDGLGVPKEKNKRLIEDNQAMINAADKLSVRAEL